MLVQIKTGGARGCPAISANRKAEPSRIGGREMWETKGV
jgi:hypothetical protein